MQLSLSCLVNIKVVLFTSDGGSYMCMLQLYSYPCHFYLWTTCPSHELGSSDCIIKLILLQVRAAIQEISDLPLQDIRLIKDKATNTSRGFCFVELNTIEVNCNLVGLFPIINVLHRKPLACYQLYRSNIQLYSQMDVGVFTLFVQNA